ncbi:nickel-dependent hydrogenase large subunit [Marinobacterium sp. D7]|uniref:nickel-dependent hydrogenase large subunit n=1 Tax=Marinobacterium ramblicola TaxID=2849041 RepID=UPI001C2D04CD|nr:nickel-dependent hydrogenase large subunit [Marinobacterium ramblicola]MBV1789506.1 nickel-dependent hydrogenase large subunit [Marinobacterium ramblicola]
MSRIVVGPFNRVEGDLDITLDSMDGQVTGARVNATLYRGFERILVGKPALDALVYTPRICGICSVSQSVAAALALADSQGLQPTRNGELCRNLILANESLTDLLTHFYLFFMPDFARDIYVREPWFDAVVSRFKAVSGEATREVLPARAEFLHLMGLLAGKWPHTLSIQPGGTTRPVQRQERLRLVAILGAFRRFLERVTFGDDLERIAAIHTPEQLRCWQREKPWHSGDLRTFLYLSQQLDLGTLGRATDRFISFGNYALQGEQAVPRGLWTPDSGLQALDPGRIVEDVSHAWMEQAPPLHPARGETEPVADKEGAYSWCKAPRLDGQVVETGALARALVAGDPLLTRLVIEQGGSVHTRMLARLLELARTLPKLQQWALQIEPGEPFCHHPQRLQDGEGVGLMEAARGSLGHWISVQRGKISHYQIIAPTTWNFSPRDASGQPGALEQALVGAPIRQGETDPVAVQHIVRSFDPCMVCTVH